MPVQLPRHHRFLRTSVEIIMPCLLDTLYSPLIYAELTVCLMFILEGPRCMQVTSLGAKVAFRYNDVKEFAMQNDSTKIELRLLCFCCQRQPVTTTTDEDEPYCCCRLTHSEQLPLNTRAGLSLRIKVFNFCRKIE